MLNELRGLPEADLQRLRLLRPIWPGLNYFFLHTLLESKPNKKSEHIKFNAELTEAEWIIIRVVWENEPCATGTVQEALAPRKGLLGLELNDERWPLVDIVPGMPAAKAGLHNGGKILTVNDSDITHITTILITDVRSSKQTAVLYEKLIE